MADTTFVSRVTVPSVAWFQDINDHVYRGAYKDNRKVFSLGDPYFGAVGDSSYDGSTGTDDSAAWANILEAALEAYADVDAVTIYIPPGKRFLIRSNNPFGNWTAASLPGAPLFKLGLTIMGAGFGSQLVWRPSSSSDVWMYDNGESAAADNSLVYPTFRHLFARCIVDDLTGSATLNGFRQWADDAPDNRPTQGFVFDHCRFLGVDRGADDPTIAKMGTFMKTAGTVNSDCNKWIGSKIRGWKTVLDIGENDDSLTHSFISTDCELIYGDVFKVNTGNSLEVFGGSFVMVSEAESYFLHLRPSPDDSLAGTFVFNGGRLELNRRLNHQDQVHSRLLKISAEDQPTAYSSSIPLVKFDSFNSYPIEGDSARDTIKIDAAMPVKVVFDGCALGTIINATQIHQVKVFTSLATLRTDSDGPYAEVDFVNGDAVPHENVLFDDANSHGIVSATNCRNVIDYTMTTGGVGQYVTRGKSRALKTAVLRGRAWPDVGDNGATNKFELKLPKGSILKSCRFRKAANGGAATAGYQLAMVDGAANQYCASSIANQNVEHKAVADDLMIVMDDALGYSAGISAPQTIYMIATAGHTGSSQAVAMAATDYAIVEYW